MGLAPEKHDAGTGVLVEDSRLFGEGSAKPEKTQPFPLGFAVIGFQQSATGATSTGTVSG